MTIREALAAKRLIIMSPNAPRAGELEAVLATQAPASPYTGFRRILHRATDPQLWPLASDILCF